MTPVNSRRKMLAIALAVGLLAAAPLALAAPGGRGGEHSHERAGPGMENAAVGNEEAAMGKQNAAAARANATADEDANETRPAGHGPRDAPGLGRNHSGLHKGFANAILHVPDFVKSFMERVLGGAHPSLAKLRGGA